MTTLFLKIIFSTNNSNTSTIVCFFFALTAFNIVMMFSGHGILNVMHQFPFIPHLLYPLLTGRLLIVTGSSKLEKEIKTTINALRLFVPGHSM